MDVTIDWKLQQIAKGGRNKIAFQKDLETTISEYRLTSIKFKGTKTGTTAESNANALQEKLSAALKGVLKT